MKKNVLLISVEQHLGQILVLVTLHILFFSGEEGAPIKVWEMFGEGLGNSLLYKNKKPLVIIWREQLLPLLTSPIAEKQQNLKCYVPVSTLSLVLKSDRDLIKGSL